MRTPRNYISYLLNPLELLRTKKVLHVNPTAIATRKEPESIRLFVYDYDPQHIDIRELSVLADCYEFIESPKTTWLNVDGLRKTDVETICNKYGIHNLITEDILSIGQRPKMDEINGLLFCILNMMYFNEKDSAVELNRSVLCWVKIL